MNDKDSSISNSMCSLISFFALNSFSLVGLIIYYRLILKILSNSIFVSSTWQRMGQFTKAAAVTSKCNYSKYDSHITVQVIMAIRSVMLQFVITDV